jgi:hypothetical protein
MTPEQLQILQHSVGADEYGRSRADRNHFCAGGGDVVICRELVALGFMQEHESRSWLPDPMFSVTRAGRRAMIEASPKPPTFTRAQRRYKAYLRMDFDMSFIDWLRAFGKDVA